MRHGASGPTPLQAALVNAQALAAAMEGAAQPAAAAHSLPPAAYINAARPMLAAEPPATALPLLCGAGEVALPLLPDLAARWPLTPAQWQQVPSPCPGLGRALPAALARSEAEAALLVARLPAANKAHLRAIALALHRRQRCLPVSLPTELVRRLLCLFDA